jgi:hypothetical protein
VSDIHARRDNHVKLQKIFIAIRTNITGDQGSRACLMNTAETLFLADYPELVTASDGRDIPVPEKGRFPEAGRACWIPGEAPVAAG